MDRIDSLKVLKNAVAWVEFGQKVSNKLSHVRHVHESDETTLDRMLQQALKTICKSCRGTRRSTIGGECRECHGTGERAYDPHIKMVKEVMQT
jgi:DnaJ-class molecular chaperone